MNGRFSSGCLIWASIVAIWVMLGAAPLAAGTAGRLAAVDGSVWTQAPRAGEIPARAGKPLVPGTRIRTGADGRAEVTFDDGSTLVVQPNTELVLSDIKRQRRPKRSILVFFGRIWNRVARALGPQARYEVNTPVVVAGVRGTEFEAAVADDGTVRVRVTSGGVSVAADGDADALTAGQEIQAGLDGIGPVAEADAAPDWAAWRDAGRQRLRTQGRFLVDAYRQRLLVRKETLETLRRRQKAIAIRRRQVIDQAEPGDERAIEEIRQTNQELITIADQIADLGDAAGSQFGLIDHFGKLAADPRFEMIDSQYVAAEAAMMRRIKAMFDEMIAAGTDISMAAMERQLQEMSEGQRGSLKFDKGSSKEELFGDDPENN